MNTLAVDTKESTEYDAMMTAVIIAEDLPTFLSIRSFDIGQANDLIPITNALHRNKVDY